MTLGVEILFLGVLGSFVLHFQNKQTSKVAESGTGA